MFFVYWTKVERVVMRNASSPNGGVGSNPTSDIMFHVANTCLEWINTHEQDSDKGIITQRKARTKRF